MYLFTLYVMKIFSRVNKIHKVWGTIYTCTASRGVFLDLVPDYLADSCLRKFSRFVSRRGCPDNVISDNRTNFVADIKTQRFISDRRI